MPTDPGFDVQITSANGSSATVRVAGEVDLATSPRLREGLTDAIDGGVDVVHVDMSDVTFLDSSGISVLVEAQQRLHDASGRLVLHTVADHIRRVLEISGLGSFFEVSDNPAS